MYFCLNWYRSIMFILYLKCISKTGDCFFSMQTKKTDNDLLYWSIFLFCVHFFILKIRLVFIYLTLLFAVHCVQFSEIQKKMHFDWLVFFSSSKWSKKIYSHLFMFCFMLFFFINYSLSIFHVFNMSMPVVLSSSLSFESMFFFNKFKN